MMMESEFGRLSETTFYNEFARVTPVEVFSTVFIIRCTKHCLLSYRKGLPSNVNDLLIGTFDDTILLLRVCSGQGMICTRQSSELVDE